MRELLKYLKNYKLQSILGPLFKLTEAIFELIVPIVMSDIIDVGIAEGDMNYVLKKGALLLLFGLIGLACSLTAQYFAAAASVGFGTELRHDLFGYITSLSYTDMDKAGAATLITRLTVDVNQVQSGVNLALRLFLRSPFIVVGAVIMSFTIDTELAVIFLVATPVIAAVVLFIMNRTIPMYRQIQEKMDRISSHSRGNLSGVRVVRAFARQSEEKKNFRETTDRLYDVSVHTGRISALINPLSYALLNIAIILIVWFGGKHVDNGRITQGEVIALVNYMSQILLALIAMVNLINSFTKAIASAGRVSEVFHIADRDVNALAVSPSTSAPKSDAFLSVDNLSFAYEGSDEESLSNISFTLEKGQTLGIIGGTGAGKTTLINLIAGFYMPSGGDIRLNGESVFTMDNEKLRREIAPVSQKRNLFSGTIRDNVLFGRKASDEQVIRALKLAQAYDFVMQKENGIDYKVEQGGTNLSGGQQQRLTIARALIGDVSLLILDDSASALDYATEAALRKALTTELEGMTVISVSQRIGSIMNADRILVLDDGRQVGFGRHEELLNSCEIYREIYQSQESAK